MPERAPRIGDLIDLYLGRWRISGTAYGYEAVRLVGGQPRGEKITAKDLAELAEKLAAASP
jgi:hypothetical protein